jgi:pyruvate dehydrogenase E1 component alpha subunit
MDTIDTLAARNHNATLGVLPGLAQEFPVSRSLDMFRQICVNRAFELETARVYDAGHIRMPIYLSLGQEHIPAAMAPVCGDALLFAQHRAHSYYLSFGGNMTRLIDELLHRETGCAGGMGGSASIHSPEIGMYGHSGLMGDQVPIAVGAALASGRRTLTVVGDASGEEDYVYGAMGYAATKKPPVLFVCEDNNLSILTPVTTRRSWSLVDVARSLGLHAVDITDDPWLIASHVELALTQLPAFINIRTCRHLWHAGTGVDGEPAWNRYEMIKNELRRLGCADYVDRIEKEAESEVKQLWREQLRKP